MEAVERKSSRANDLLCHIGNGSKMAALALKAAHYRGRMRVYPPPDSTKLAIKSVS